MYSRKELGELALRRINSGPLKPEFNIDIREVMYAIDQERDRQVGDYYKRKVLSGDRQIEGSVLQDYTLGNDMAKRIETNSTAYTYYIYEMPVKVISLPYDLGVYEVSDEETPLITFDRMPPSMGLYSYTTYGTDIQALDSFFEGNKSPKWSIQGNHIHVYSQTTPRSGIRVRALTAARSQDAVVQFPGGTTSPSNETSYSWETGGTYNISDYPIPAELVAPVIDAVVARYSYQKPYDSVIDNQDRV